jgi:hypothetical protein
MTGTELILVYIRGNAHYHCFIILIYVVFRYIYNNSGREMSDGGTFSEYKIKLDKGESGRGLILSTIPLYA